MLSDARACMIIRYVHDATHLYTCLHMIPCEVGRGAATPTTSLWLRAARRHPLTQAVLIRLHVNTLREDSLCSLVIS